MSYSGPTPSSRDEGTSPSPAEENRFAPAFRILSEEKLLPLLQSVEKPGRYVGGEFGIHTKDPARATVRLLLSYPDIYEIGMSNQGLKVLYDAVNREENFVAERAFLPWEDMGEALRRHGLPLHSLESRIPADSFHIWGFNLSHELLFTNLLHALTLAGIPRLRRERRASDPIILAGGTSITNPLPLLDFVDGFFLGDGEEGIVELLRVAERGLEEGVERSVLLERMETVEGFLASHRVELNEEGIPPEDHQRVRPRIYRHHIYGELQYNVVPTIQVTQDRVVLEAARGCGQGCRFCHAGYWKRPVRNSSVSSLVEAARSMLARTGNDSLSLNSLSLADYPHLEELVGSLSREFAPRGISLSLPSLRVDSRTLPVLEATAGIRKSSVTFALEAGSEYMRARIRKNSSEEHLRTLVRDIFARGWDLVKIYFMVGLPDDRGREVEELMNALRGLDLLARECGSRKNINVTVSLFVPKPHTTFQWEKLQSPDYFENAIRTIYDGPRLRRIRIKHPDPWMAYVEGILSRSDARMGRYLLQAYERGARFDSWDDRFSVELWRSLLQEIPADLLALWTEERPVTEELLPWERVVAGVPGNQLRRDHEKFRRITPENYQPDHLRDRHRSRELEAIPPVEMGPERFEMKEILEIRFRKRGGFVYISHLDTMEAIRRACRRAGIPMTFSRGFNKHEKFHFTDSLPLYVHSLQEILYVELYASVDPAQIHARLASSLPAGLELDSLALHNRLPSRELRPRRYRMEFRDEALEERIRGALADPVELYHYEKVERKKRGPRRPRGGVKVMEKRVKSALSHYREEPGALEFTLDPPDSGAISVADLVVRYLETPVELWNRSVKLIRIPVPGGESQGV